MKLFGNKKKAALGFEKKSRSKAEIDTDYSNQAFTMGHKMRLLEQSKGQCERLEAEISEHLQALCRINAEGLRWKAENPETKDESAPVDTIEPETVGNA